ASCARVSLRRPWSVMVSSVSAGFWAAIATDWKSIRAMSRTADLNVIFSGHCTPVQGVEKGSVRAPAGLHAHVQIQIDLTLEQFFHLMTRLCADLFEHGSANANHNRLL